jgi:hypothetical protein
VRVLTLLAVGAFLVAGAFLALRRADARSAREAEARERALRQARDQQAATAEILGVIAASPPDLQRVLDAIARNAARVCDGLHAVVFRFDGAEIRLTAHHGVSSARLKALEQRYPRGPDDETPTARAIRAAAVVHFPDIPSDPDVPTWRREVRFDGALIDLVAHYGMSAESLEEYRRIYPLSPAANTTVVRSIRDGVIVHTPDLLEDPSEPVRRLAEIGRYRTVIVVPMSRSGRAVGAIGVARSDPSGGPRPFTASPSSPRSGAARATSSTSASASPGATRRSARSASRGGGTTLRSGR